MAFREKIHFLNSNITCKEHIAQHVHIQSEVNDTQKYCTCYYYSLNFYLNSYNIICYLFIFSLRILSKWNNYFTVSYVGYDWRLSREVNKLALTTHGNTTKRKKDFLFLFMVLFSMMHSTAPFYDLPHIFQLYTILGFLFLKLSFTISCFPTSSLLIKCTYWGDLHFFWNFISYIVNS